MCRWQRIEIMQVKVFSPVILVLWLTLLIPVFCHAQKPELVIQIGHSSGISSVCFSPDGKTLASGSWDKTIRLWDVATGKELKSLQGHAREIMSVCFSPD